MKNGKRMLALLVVLALSASLFALPAGASTALPSPSPIPEQQPFGDPCSIILKDGNSVFYTDTVEKNGTWNLEDALIGSPTRAGYVFRGWFLSENPGPEERPTSSIPSVTENVTLYAVWDVAAPTATPTPAPNPYTTEGAAIVAATATSQTGGEMPVINKGDRFNLVVKVVDHSAARFQIPVQDIAARVNSSVFTFTGTAEVGQLFDETDPVTGSHYYSYVLIFRDIIYNGGGDEFVTDLSYLNSTLAMQQLHFTLGQCAQAGETPEPTDKTRTPNLVVRQSSYGNTAVTAGTPFSLDVTVFATAGSESLADVIASVTLPKGITLTGGSLSQYVGGMAAGATTDVHFQVLPSAAFTDGVADLTIHLTGTGAQSGEAVTSDTIISVPVLQPDRFEVTSVDCSDTVYIGQGGSITVNFVNKGRNVVANLEAEIQGNNLGADIPRVYVGNVNAGTENSVDFSLYPEQPGPMDGTITLTYESEDGTVKTLTETFSATAMEMENYYDPGMFEDPGMMEDPSGGGMPVWGWVLIALAVIAGGTAAVLLVRRRKKARALASLGEADDEDF